MSRFNDAVLEVSSFDQAVGIAAVISGLKHDRFRDSLIEHTAITFSEVNDRSLKFITAEEYALAQNPPPSKNQNPEWRYDNPSRKRMRMAQNRGKPPVTWTSFNLPRSQIFMQIKNKMDLRRPGPMRTAAASRDHTRYCDFHEDHGHTTEQCNSLKSELESLAQKGMLNEYVQKAEQPRFVKEQRPQPQGVRNPPNRQGVGYQQAPPLLPPPARIIHMITEGLEAAQKRKIDDAEWKNQPITFTYADLDTVVTPHNDSLVTFVMINNCEVQRVLVDTGNALDIMYFHCFESLGLDPALLQKYDGSIYGFNNQPVPVEGVLTLHVAFGSGRTYVAPPVRFLVVKMASSFNIVIGRPTLTEIRAVVSQSHLCMKFPTPMGIATLRGNQEMARHCYITSVTQPTKGKDQTPEAFLNEFLIISNVLHGAELRYPIAEKAALAVVTSARKLRPYFQSHPIIVLTDQPLRQILQKPECSGRLIKWAVELGEFEITFQQRSAIRAQALADFIVECTPCPSIPNPEPNNWTLYVDGASSSKGSGAGALLIGPEGYRSEHALKFNFDATNNMAKYEALLLGLQLALELKISAIQVYSDSQLVVNQINSICEVVDPVMLFKFQIRFVEVLDEPSFMKPRMMEISTNPDTPSWTDSIISFLQDGIVPEDRQEATKLRKKASRYTLVDGVLYKRSFSLPLLRCLNPYEAEYALREVHEGVCGSHVGARTLAHKVLRQGYYWPNMYKDATYFVQKCPKCPFVKRVGGVTHLVVGVDYFTKWVEARPLSSLTSKKVEDFVFSSIICRYGIPNQIVADNGTQFNCSSFQDFCSSYGIKLQFTSVYHPESNGMVEFVNKCILEGETPYHLAFGTEAVIPIEIGVPSFRVTHFNEGRNGQLLRENLDLLAEVREEARLRTLGLKLVLVNSPRIGKALIPWPRYHILVPMSSKTLKEREFLESGMSIT
ncbi:hypothetical protein SLEP1_g13729 [Rubroshorea leprosula]|nr:hypothetical protein SLEP1_g13729 [Rubroshorea leprosula]